MTKLAKSPIIVALDDVDMTKLFGFVKDLTPYVASFKLGLEFFSRYGAEGVAKFTEQNIPIFLDLKLHDIPNTVAQAVKQLCLLNIDMLTIHISGGEAMLKAAVAARDSVNKNVKLLGISVLTSLDDNDLAKIGCRYASQDQVVNLFNLAGESGLDAVVCSAQEVSLLQTKNHYGLEFITPGIRLAHEISSAQISDQKRVVTPKDAINNGSDYLVIGRSITGSSNPIATCKQIIEDLIPNIINK